MDVVVERCAGLDVHRDSVVATVRLPGKGKSRRRREQQTRSFGTTVAQLETLADWLAGFGVTLVGMEATGVYWRPVFWVLERRFECWLLNAQHLHNVPGRKSDLIDSAWCCQLLEHGLVRPSFVPPPEIRRLRDLTRLRSTQMEERSRAIQRLEKVLQDAGIKFSSVASNTYSVSARAMLEALLGGVSDPATLAELAKGKLRAKIPQLHEALANRFELAHHGVMVAQLLAHIDALDETVANLDGRIGETTDPYAELITLLSTIPGVGRYIAEVLIAECGLDMTVFPSAEHLVSWAGICPGTNQSGGKRGSGKTRHGDHWLRTGEVAMEAKRKRASRVRVERGVYQQPNGKYAVCFMLAGKPRFRTVEGDLEAARREREVLAAAAEAGALSVSPRLRFATVAGRWLARFEERVAAGERRERTLEAHRYYLDKHLLPALGRRLIRTIGVEDVAALLTALRAKGCSEKTTAGALATLHSVVRFALRNGWAVDDAVSKLEADERPHPLRRRQRVLGRDDIQRLLAASLPRYRPLLATAIYSGMRISELLGLVWEDIDFATGVVNVRAQLSRAHRGAPARRVPPKTPSALRGIPLVPQLADVLLAHRRASAFGAGGDWVFTTGRGTPLGHRNVQRRALGHAATIAGLENGDWPPLRFHDLRHTFASHLILDLGLDVVQVSRILGHARVTTTLDVYSHLFDEARHAAEIRARMAASAFAQLLTHEDAAAATGNGRVVALRAGAI